MDLRRVCAEFCMQIFEDFAKVRRGIRKSLFAFLFSG